MTIEGEEINKSLSFHKNSQSICFFKTCKERFSLREERVRGEPPKCEETRRLHLKRRKKEQTHTTNTRETTPHGQQGSAHVNTEKTRTSPLAKQLVGTATQVEVPQDHAFRKGATRTPSSSTYPQSGRPGLHLANQGVWRPRQCPQQG
jgi:hypothetical protein